MMNTIRLFLLLGTFFTVSAKAVSWSIIDVACSVASDSCAVPFVARVFVKRVMDTEDIGSCNLCFGLLVSIIGFENARRFCESPSIGDKLIGSIALIGCVRSCVLFGRPLCLATWRNAIGIISALDEYRSGRAH